MTTSSTGWSCTWSADGNVVSCGPVDPTPSGSDRVRERQDAAGQEDQSVGAPEEGA